jgi:autotransporter-associated beta strand protein
MKIKLKLHSLSLLATGPMVVVSLTPNAFAASLEWAGSSTGLATGASNDWDSATTANWSDGIGLVNWPTPGGTDDDAVFGGTAGTVTITTVTANDIAFNTNGYTLTGGTLTLNGTTPTLTTGGGIDATVSSTIDGTTGLVKSGGGSLTISSANLYSGGTTLSGGTLVAANDSAFGSGGVVMNDATLRAGVGPVTSLANPVQIDGSNSVFDAPIGSNLQLNGNLTGSGLASSAGQWAVILGGNNSGFTGIWTNGSENPNNLTSFATADSGSASAEWVLVAGRMVNAASGTTTIHLGALSGNGGILSNNTSGQVTFSVGALDTDANFSGSIQNAWGGGGTTAIVKVGDGQWTLGGNNNYSGGTTIFGGTIVAANNSVLGTGTLVMNGGSLRAGVSPTTTLSNSFQIDGSGNVFNAPFLNNLALNGNMTGSGSVSVAGEWAVVLGGDNSGFTGTWTSGSESPNNITRFTSADSGSAGAQWVLDGGRMVNSAGSNPTISLGSLSGTGGILSNDTGGTVTYSIGALNTDTTFGGSIANEWGGGGTAAITKVGTGKLTLTGGGTYTGPTSVLGGTLEIDGSLGNTAVTVNSASLAGNGSIAGTVTLETGGNLVTSISDWTGTGGTGFEDLGVQSLVIQSGTPHVITVDSTGLVNFSESAATFPIILTAGGISGFNSSDFSVSAPGFPGTGTWTVEADGLNLELVYSPASASVYDSWATAKGLTGINNAKGFDADDDGLTNLQEFAFDGNPLSGANDGKQVSVLADPDGAGPETTALILTLPVRNTAVFNGPGDLVSDPVDGIIYQIQGSVDLVDFTTMNISEVTPALDSGLPALSTGWTYRSFRAPGPLGTREFIRAAVVESP